MKAIKNGFHCHCGCGQQMKEGEEWRIDENGDFILERHPKQKKQPLERPLYT